MPVFRRGKVRLDRGARPGLCWYMSVIAIAAGVGASILSAQFMRSVLFGIASSDPVTRWSAAGLLLIVALGASWIPARRAAHVHPMDALRRE
jgi:ABC-type antimicrobial peptide transport system permease subunit